MSDGPYRTMREFYPFYLNEHRRLGTRVAHFVGTTLAIGFVAAAVATRFWWLLAGAPVAAYACAWFGHFFIEKNRPATFQHPLLSLVSDFRLYGELLAGRQKWRA